MVGGFRNFGRAAFRSGAVPLRWVKRSVFEDEFVEKDRWL
jgi:hypothetical protein